MQRAEEVYREHERLVRAVCERMVGSADAQDIVQDAFVRALTRPPADQEQPIKPWLVKVARNLAIDHLRRRRRVDVVADTADLPWDDTTDEEPQEDPEDISELRRAGVAAVLVACEALPPTERGVVLLRDLLELTTRETASVLGLSDGSVKVLHHRARKTLAQPRDLPSGPMGTSTVDALERFVRWLTARELAGIPVRDQASTEWDGMAEPALSSAGVIASQTTILRAIVDAARNAGRPAVLVRALLCLGNLERFAGDLDAALEHLKEAAALAASTGDGEMVVRAHSTLSSTYAALGQDERAQWALTIALESASLRETAEEGALRCRLAESLVHQGKVAEAAAQLELVSALLEAKNDQRARMAALIQRGHHALTVDDFVAAMARWTEALEIAKRLGDHRSEAAVRGNMGLTFTALADAGRAREQLLLSTALAREVGARQIEAINMGNLALLEQDERDLGAAAVHHEQSVALFRALGNRRSTGVSLFNSGVCALLRGRHEQATALMASARTIIAEGGPDVIDPYADTFEAAALLVRGDPTGRSALERVRREAAAADRPTILLAVDALEGIADVHRGDVDSARARLKRAIPRWVEVRTAIHLLENAIASFTSGTRGS